MVKKAFLRPFLQSVAVWHFAEFATGDFASHSLGVDPGIVASNPDFVDTTAHRHRLDWLDSPHRLPSSGVATGPFWLVDIQFAYNSVGFFSGWAQAYACNGHIAFCRS